MHTPAFKGVSKLTLTCWNIRTILDAADSGHPESRSTPIAHELSCLNINIAALSEVPLHEEGSLREHGASYTLFWSEAAEFFELEVNLKKTEVFYQPASQEVFHHPHITIGKSELKSVQQFNYLGSIISLDGKIDEEIDNRLAKAYLNRLSQGKLLLLLVLAEQ
ncbi:hypothetical protein BTVI_55184 [Pitangus sulphuratus]|nr:hypothetical protein BTVI_55184 [Pitangus sulphuratus]